jgi:hypothetical protein
LENRTRAELGQITLFVGQAEGDLRGDDDRVIQAGVDYVARLGGGCVHLGSGTYHMRHGLRMASGVSLLGSGPDTVLLKRPGEAQLLARDSDWYETSVEVADATAYRPGDAIMLRSYVDKSDRLRSVVRETVTKVEGGILWLSGRLRSNMWLEDRTSAAPLFPLISAAEETHDVRIENLTLDGNLDGNDEINGNYSGGVFLQRCDRWHFSRVTSRNYNGDGFSFQVCDDVSFSQCRAEGNANLGFHPGSGSQRPVFENCISVNNNQGIFFCWGVTDGRAEGCTCSDNRDYGISIGHRDTDNRIVDCEIERNHKVGLLFREQEAFRAGHRNLVTGCTIRDNGYNADGVGVEVRGETHDIVLEGNVIADTGQQKQRIGIRIGEKADKISSGTNTFIGLNEDVVMSSKQEEKKP